MTDKKFHGEEIIKALMCHFNEELDEEPFRCVDCPLYNDTSPSCTEALKSYALDFINRQKAENDCAKAKIKICAEVINRQDKEIERLKGWEDVLKAKEHSLIKYTAYKEFAEKLKKELLSYRKKCRNALDNESVFVVDKVKRMIDNLLKEMVGEK